MHRHIPGTPAWLLWPDPWVWALLLLLLLPVIWWYWNWLARRRAVRYSSTLLLAAAASPWPRRARAALRVLRLAALACLIVAVARPQKADESSQVFAEGIAIQMVIDTSSSMNDEDLSPRGQRQTRLDVVKDVFRRFVAGDGELPGRPNDLIGMIRFAKFADSVVPLTLDHNALLEVLAGTFTVRPQSEEDGTAIGDGLALAVERMKDLKRTSGSGEQLVIKSRVIILLTDGENREGVITPRQAGELAATYGIKVYAIMAGTGVLLAPGIRQPIDTGDLKFIAAATGGRFYNARDRRALTEICEEIDALERTRTEERRFVRWSELATPSMLVWAIGLFGASALLDATRLRRIP